MAKLSLEEIAEKDLPKSFGVRSNGQMFDVVYESIGNKMKGIVRPINEDRSIEGEIGIFYQSNETFCFDVSYGDSEDIVYWFEFEAIIKDGKVKNSEIHFNGRLFFTIEDMSIINDVCLKIKTFIEMKEKVDTYYVIF